MLAKRLLLISSNSSARGGGERYLVYLTEGLRLLNCDVHVLLSTATYMDGWAVLLTEAGAQVHRRKLLGLRSRPLRFLQSMTDKNQQREVTKVCQEIVPDAILVNQQYDEDGLDYLAGALLADVAPVGGLLHMPMTAHKDQRPLGKLRGHLLRQWYQQHPYGLLLVSKGSQAEFEQYYPAPRPTQVVTHGCSFPALPQVPPELPTGWSDRSPVPTIGFLGQFVAQKNLQLLIEAWLWTRQQGCEIRLLLVGEGPERKALEQRLDSAAPRSTWHITGWQEQPERYLSAIDIYAMTSHFEGLPLALLEAAGRGIPAVITNFNGAWDVAQQAEWVKVVNDTTVESVGKTLMETLHQLVYLKQQAKEGESQFRDYFSLQRMASDTLTALGIA
ncbi:MAG: glycosyltransferase family 4 protein [Leptolyngbyaceae bacterium]|nr:glycosyltransferase family 4 protein [Leptolyngbyaceae bacterium]